MRAPYELCQQMSEAGEQAVAELLRARGHTVRLDGGNSYHDLVVEGTTTVEVKTAYPTAPANGKSARWQFALYDADGQHAPMQEDLLILRCMPSNGGSPQHFVIPGSVVPRRLTKIDITNEPADYAGRYCLFLEAWQLADAVVALRAKDGRQPALIENDELACSTRALDQIQSSNLRDEQSTRRNS